MSLTINDKELDSQIESVLPEITSIRRIIHQNPELSGSEKETARLVYDNLRKIGLKPSFHLDKTAVTASLNNGRGKTIVLRADMDALPIEEQTGLSFTSKKKGLCTPAGTIYIHQSFWGQLQYLTRSKTDGKAIYFFYSSHRKKLNLVELTCSLKAAFFPKGRCGLWLTRLHRSSL